MHNKKKESELTNAERGEIFESDVDVELDDNEHVDNDFKFKIFVAKELMHLASKKGKLVNVCHICYFESKDVPTQMTKQSSTIIYFITFKKTIHFKIICKNVHS